MGEYRRIYMVSAILFLIAIHIFAASPPIPKFGQWLLKWQDLTAGLLALLGAYWAFFGIRQQIAADRELSREDLRRRHNSARVIMPLALSNLSKHLRAVSDEIAVRYTPVIIRAEYFEGFVDEIRVQPSPFEPIELTPGLVQTFRDFVETLDDPGQIKHMAELISTLQILIARIEDWKPTDANASEQLTSYMIDCSKILMLNDTLYNYTRFVEDRMAWLPLNSSWTDVWEHIKQKAGSLLFGRGPTDPLLTEVIAKIDGYKERGYNPWNEKFD